MTAERPERQALIAYRLERTRESLEEAALLLGAGRANAAVNRFARFDPTEVRPWLDKAEEFVAFMQAQIGNLSLS